MKTKALFLIISLLIFGSGAATVYDMELNQVTSDGLPWTNMIIGTVGIILSVVAFRNKRMQ